MKNWKLLEPIKIRRTWMRNRIVMAAMEARLNTPDGSVTPAMIDYYAARARGGAGAVIVENTYIDDRSSRSGNISSGLYNDHLIAGKSLLADAIKDEGALSLLQLSHGGPQANPAASGHPILLPSLFEGFDATNDHRVLDAEEIDRIETDFARAAFRAYQAGFDGVEFHAAHGYLLSSFLSPRRNHRTDEYGGSAQGRALIVMRIIEKTRALVGENFILGVRMNATDGIEGGVTPEIACQTAQLLEPYADYLSVSAGFGETCGQVMITPNYVPAATLVPLIRQVKAVVNNVPVFGAGALDYQSAERSLRDGWFDVGVFGRSMIADPEWPNKLKAGRQEDIRSCCRGNEGCFSRMLNSLPIRCEVNPACGQEQKYQVRKTRSPKKIAVVGGGIAGMECARLGALMGHEVTLYERSEKLGGHVTEASEPDFKAETKKVLDWLVTQVHKSNAAVCMGCEITPESEELQKADVVIVAVGSRYILPPVEGARLAALPDAALLAPQTLTGENTVIIGGGMVGAETALHLSEKHQKNVVLLEMGPSIAQEHDPVARGILEQKLQDNKVKILLNCRATGITQNGVTYVDDAGERREIACDSAILATGLQPDDEQREKFSKQPNALFVGDCVKAAKIYEAMHRAWRLMFTLEEEEVL